MSRRMTLLLFAVVAAQVIGLIAFAGMRQMALTQGREVVLQTVPVDPRSLMQGDYAILDYEIAELPVYFGEAWPGDTVYVVLQEGPDVWYAINYQWDEPGRRDVYIQGRVDERERLDFGIGTYFIPEGTGHVIERARDVKVVVAIGERGNAVIKRVLVDGEPFDPVTQ